MSAGWWVGAAGTGLALLLGLPASGAAHLFHFQNVPVRETQVSADYRLLLGLVEFGRNRFDLAREVWIGARRAVLPRPAAPGLVVKGVYQTAVRVPPLRERARAAEGRLGRPVVAPVEAALAARDLERLQEAFRAFFVAELMELLDAMAARLDRPDVTAELFGVARQYFALAWEFHLLTRVRPRYFDARASLEDVAESLGSAGRPPSPEAFARSRARLLEVLTHVLRGGA